jgi:hypothetical protein
MTAVGVDAIHSRIHAGQHRIVGMNTNIIYIYIERKSTMKTNMRSIKSTDTVASYSSL